MPSSPQDGPFGPGWIKGKKRLKGEESKPVPTDPAEPTTPELSFPWVCKRSRQSTLTQQCKSAEDLLLGGTQSLEIKTKVTKGSQERRRSRKSRKLGDSSDADALSALSELFSE